LTLLARVSAWRFSKYPKSSSCWAASAGGQSQVDGGLTQKVKKRTYLMRPGKSKIQTCVRRECNEGVLLVRSEVLLALGPFSSSERRPRATMMQGSVRDSTTICASNGMIRTVLRGNGCCARTRLALSHRGGLVSD
jgi:hypothetical protein